MDGLLSSVEDISLQIKGELFEAEGDLVVLFSGAAHGTSPQGTSGFFSVFQPDFQDFRDGSDYTLDDLHKDNPLSPYGWPLNGSLEMLSRKRDAAGKF